MSRAFLGIKFPRREKKLKEVIPFPLVRLPHAPYWNAPEEEVVRVMGLVGIEFNSEGRLVNWPAEDETRAIMMAFRRAAANGVILQFAESLRFNRWREFVQALDTEETRKRGAFGFIGGGRAALVDTTYWKMFGGRKYFGGRCPHKGGPRDLESCLRCDIFDLPRPDFREPSNDPISQPMMPPGQAAAVRANVVAKFLSGAPLDPRAERPHPRIIYRKRKPTAPTRQEPLKKGSTRERQQQQSEPENPHDWDFRPPMTEQAAQNWNRFVKWYAREKMKELFPRTPKKK